ncbi:hypothetical protein AURANDRAFT_68026 [Aureococcus anophagefferens]|uniref:Uncharacterized protein n=1 Tax=Aureococcus anophagefferens TaxID=44056 RepID=F0YN93_AURAN|nr:hypothetical protein AURANDRAFT_68026 [Aureococcus anophagefferens]EGB03406.1 hypothetical protein AURANDRAFT_68026 [Aureococcus anophagefferens]|eukprot:XP_009041877.1 hypothetical protein AURANDRAFT_68026 [Aureococcus anophagefferens]
MRVLCGCYAGGMRVVCGWYAPAMRVVCGWYAGRMRVVCGLYAGGMRLLCWSYAAAMLVVCGCYAATSGGRRLGSSTAVVGLLCWWYAPDKMSGGVAVCPGDFHFAISRKLEGAALQFALRTSFCYFEEA